MYRENESSNSPAGGRPCHARETTVGICDGQINRSQFFSKQKTGGLGIPSCPTSSNPSLPVAFEIGWPTARRENCAGLRTRFRMKGRRSLEKTGPRDSRKRRPAKASSGVSQAVQSLNGVIRRGIDHFWPEIVAIRGKKLNGGAMESGANRSPPEFRVSEE
jgi:hypothetical protein